MSDESANEESASQAKPLSAVARRCLGVLIEKAKTTPDAYPLSLAGIITGCNQKSNRDPKMNVDEGDALRALDELREAGAVREIQGSGRVTKYRHAAYEWFNVDSPGSAIMTELLLRGPQTLGELRTRASRMHPFVDLTAAQAEVGSLIEKGLVFAVTPPGRGQTFAHCLYTPVERQHLAAKVEKQASEESSAKSAPAAGAGSLANEGRIDKIQQRLDDVTARLEALEAKLADLES
ncbi:YceH family protein [Aporhodopirellula aestuarii]|uniref:YceH family protein n=1 Tax=Aporhodopirellula aestuarii TaxID=2950107 RepID=A0ABT0UDN5_9BACT|nr:YceH family protein [Aporhodopirellula aestuarii]MCM2374999.1 YceH family protein [Aporhodopirellula aestuarii]